MKRILLACFLLTATCSVSFIQTATAQMTPPPVVTLPEFTAKVNQMDTYIGAGDMTNAQATWLLVHTMMGKVLATSKYSIYAATTPADKTAHTNIMIHQRDLYSEIWALKPDLATNRIAIHAKLVEFGATIY
jgi:hypothetical protein